MKTRYPGYLPLGLAIAYSVGVAIGATPLPEELRGVRLGMTSEQLLAVRPEAEVFELGGDDHTKTRPELHRRREAVLIESLAASRRFSYAMYTLENGQLVAASLVRGSRLEASERKEFLTQIASLGMPSALERHKSVSAHAHFAWSMSSEHVVAIVPITPSSNGKITYGFQILTRQYADKIGVFGANLTPGVPKQAPAHDSSLAPLIREIEAVRGSRGSNETRSALSTRAVETPLVSAGKDVTPRPGEGEPKEMSGGGRSRGLTAIGVAFVALVLGGVLWRLSRAKMGRRSQ
jgi:hypothetical protein